MDYSLMDRKDWAAQQRRNVGVVVCTVAGLLGFLLVVLVAGNHGYVTPLYTWLANVGM